MTEVRVAYVDVYPMRLGPVGIQFLLLRRRPGRRCPGSWEAVHGHIEPGERPAEAAKRELAEETGFVPAALYNLSRVETFYHHAADAIALIPVFAAIVAPDVEPTLGAEHDAAAWLLPDEAAARCAWPREARAMADAARLLAGGDAGPVEDVLRVC